MKMHVFFSRQITSSLQPWEVGSVDYHFTDETVETGATAVLLTEQPKSHPISCGRWQKKVLVNMRVPWLTLDLRSQNL